jgi:hypothetical protein
MTLMKLLLLALAALLTAAAALGLRAESRDRAQAARVWAALEALTEADPPRYDPAMVEGLPEVARRYFARAIAPGTPLHRVVRLEMEGSFILNGTPMPMAARQILAPPARGFVWQAGIGAGMMRFAGSDGYRRETGRETGRQAGREAGRETGREAGREESWTSFWLHGLVPLARIGGTPDHARAAATRVMMEAIWAPATLLPQFGAEWIQTGPDSAEVRFADAPGLEPMRLTLDAGGTPLEVVALRWTDANPERVWRLQPFGGRVLETGLHGGFRIPVRVEMGNMWGTPEAAPFFLATITRAEF